jgi:O-antigen/teichoic acid export membrane protein
VAACVTSVLLLVATPALLPLVFGAEFADAIPVALVMVVAGAVEATNAVGGECLRGLGQPRAVLIAECVGLGVTIVALPVLVMLMGIMGAACASLLSYSAILVAQQRLMRAPAESALVEIAAGMPPKLDSIA